MKHKPEQGFSGNPDLRFLYIYPDRDFPDIPESYFDGRYAVLLRDICYTDKQGRDHCARRGELTDGGSIPRALWDFIGGPFTYCLVAYIIHDHYCKRAEDLAIPDRRELRQAGDNLFREILDWIDEACKYIDVPEWKEYVLYKGVRFGSWSACRA